MTLYAAVLCGADLGWSQPEQAAEMAEYGAFHPAAAAVMRGAALCPSPTATTVRVNGGEGGGVRTPDGPYAESKKVLTGLFLLECADLDGPVALAAQIPAAWDGAVEVRPVIPMG